jgi:hypothetical protein
VYQITGKFLENKLIMTLYITNNHYFYSPKTST